MADFGDIHSNLAIGASQAVRRNAANSAFEAYTPNVGTVTSVGLSLPGIFTVSGSPVTSSGTLTASLATQSANLVFAGPSSGSAAAPTFRALVAADIPSLDTSKLTSGLLPIARGGTNVGSQTSDGVNYFDGTKITSGGRFKFDGTDAILIDPTAATSGAPHVSSPYLYFKGAEWDGSATSPTGARIRTFSQNPTGVETAGLSIGFMSNATWDLAGMPAFSYANDPSNYLTTQIRLGSPAYGGHGGMLEVTYDGYFTFKKLTGAVSGLNAPLIGPYASTFPVFTSNPAGYGAEIRAYLNFPILLTSGYPGWEGTYADHANALGSEYVQCDLPMGIGVSGSPAAQFHVIKTTEQSRLGYDASNYGKDVISSTGVWTRTAVGSAAKHVFGNPVTAPAAVHPVADADYTVLTTDELIEYTSITATRTVTLPSATSRPGQRVVVKDMSGGAATHNIAVSTSNPFIETIDASGTYVISTNYGFVSLISDSGSWCIVAKA